MPECFCCLCATHPSADRMHLSSPPSFSLFFLFFLSLTHSPSLRHLSSPCSCLCALTSQFSGEMRMDRSVFVTTRCSLLTLRNRVFRLAWLFLNPECPRDWPALVSLLSCQIREQDFSPGSETQPKAERCRTDQGLSAASLLQCFSRELTEPWQVSFLSPPDSSLSPVFCDTFSNWLTLSNPGKIHAVTLHPLVVHLAYIFSLMELGYRKKSDSNIEWRKEELSRHSLNHLLVSEAVLLHCWACIISTVWVFLQKLGASNEKWHTAVMSYLNGL